MKEKRKRNVYVSIRGPLENKEAFDDTYAQLKAKAQQAINGLRLISGKLKNSIYGGFPKNKKKSVQHR